MFLTSWSSELLIPVVDADTGMSELIGPLNKRVPLSRKIPNSPFSYFYPDEKICILNWEKCRSSIQREVKETRQEQEAKGLPKDDSAELTNRLWLKRLQSPVEYEGVKYHGDWAWGSAAKEKQSIGLEKDLLYDGGDGLFLADAHYPYASRALIPNAMYGAGIYKDIRILFLPVGTEFAGHIIGDGMGLVADEDIVQMRSNSADIKLSRNASSSYLRDQRFNWGKIHKEAKPLIEKACKNLDTRDWELFLMDSDSGAYKKELIAIDEIMVRHPYIAMQIQNGLAQYLAEVATTVPLPGKTRLAVPAKGEEFVVPKGQYLMVRWPVDSWSSIQAVEVMDESPDLERVEAIKAVQYTLFNPNHMFAKGMAIRVPKDEMKGYDLVLCCEDAKVMTEGVNKMRKQCVRDGKYDYSAAAEFVFAITESFDEGTAAGIPHKLWKEQFGGDFDGDYLTVYDASNVPSMMEDVVTWPEATSFKIPKVFRDVSHRAEMLLDSMEMMTGFAVNVVSSTFCVAPDDRSVVAHVLGKDTVEELDRWCNVAIKVMTDGFKSSEIDLKKWRAVLAKAQSQLSDPTNGFGGMVPWPRWKRSSWAFRRGLPKFHDELNEKYVAFVNSPDGKNHRREDEWQSHIPITMYDSTIAQIYQVARPLIARHFNKVIVHGKDQFRIKEYIRVKQLSDFASWAEPCTEYEMDLAWELKSLFDDAVTKVRWKDVKYSVPAFKETWQRVCDEFAEKFESRMHAAWAAWRAFHHARSDLNSAAGVFLGFPEESKVIVNEKPGLDYMGDIMTLVVGVQHNVRETKDEYQTQLVDIDEVVRGNETRLVVLSVNSDFPMLLPVRIDGSLENQIGTIGKIEKSRADKGFSSPGPGRYLAKFKRMGASEGAYVVRLRRTTES